jgi:hypothetical protein
VNELAEPIKAFGALSLISHVYYKTIGGPFPKK